MTNTELVLEPQENAQIAAVYKSGFANGRISEQSCAGRKFTLDCRTSLAEMEALKPCWVELENKSEDGFDYFQTFDWCYGWAKAFLKADGSADSNCIPQIFVLRQDDEIVMIWPLVRTQGRFGMAFLETMTEPLGQYCNVLRDAGIVDQEIAGWVWKCIKQHSNVDAISLNHYPSGSFLDGVIGEEGTDEAIEYVSSILDFDQLASWDDYTATLSKSQRKNRSRRLRKLEAEGDVTFEVHFHDSSEFTSLIHKSIEFKREWLKETGRHSQSLFEVESAEFLANLEYASGCENEGPVIHTLNLNGNPIGLEISMIKDRHYYSYLGAIDLAWKDFSPGKIQMEMTQKWAFDHGISKFDYLSDPSDYKQSWTNHVVPMKTRYFPITIRGQVYCRLWKAQLKPMLRQAYQKSSPDLRRRVNSLLGLEKT